MAQSFTQATLQNNMYYVPEASLAMGSNYMYLFPHNIYESVSLNNVAFWAKVSAANNLSSVTAAVNLYSLTGSTFSFVTSQTLRYGTNNTSRALYNFSNMGGTNLTPGTWYWGISYSTVLADIPIILTGNTLTDDQAWPNAYLGGRVTTGGNTSFQLSNVSPNVSDGLFLPLIIVTA